MNPEPANAPKALKQKKEKTYKIYTVDFNVNNLNAEFESKFSVQCNIKINGENISLTVPLLITTFLVYLALGLTNIQLTLSERIPIIS